MRKPFLIYIPLLLGTAALPVPLLGDFHIESAMLVSLVGCFWAGLKACGLADGRQSDFRAALLIVGRLFLFGLPLLVYAVIRGCFSFHGLGFWLLLSIPSVYFGYAAGRLVRSWGIGYCRSITVCFLVLVSAGVLLIEFFSFPQVYFFNHVWGYWPGPIYDQNVQLTESVFVFRGLTTLWIVLLWFIPAVGKDSAAKWVVLLSAVALVAGYTRLAEAGIVSPSEYLQSRLGGKMETEHFLIYYDRRHYSDEEIALTAKEHEFYFHQIAGQLKLDKPAAGDKVESYLYAHPWQKKRLVGAKFTSYVPVWLERDQLHIAKQQLQGSLKHELVHIMAKAFGNRLFNGSWSIGLIEGLAVALASGDSPRSTVSQLVVSDKPLPTVDQMKKALSPLGFYGGRSAVNYTTTGAFVKYLLERYPVENFKEAYRSGNMEEAYPGKFSELVEGWKASLDTVRVDSVDREIAERLFGIPSLFERECPRIMSSGGQALDRYRFHLADHDTSAALTWLDRALSHKPDNTALKAEWAYRHLKEGLTGKVRAKATLQDSSLELQLLYADAYALGGEWEKASAYVNRALALAAGMEQSERSEREYGEAIATRINPEQWDYYLALSYRNKILERDIFAKAYYRTKIRAVQDAMEEGRGNLLGTYADALLRLPAGEEYFDAYISMIHRLGYLFEFEKARRWTEKLREELNLRRRYMQRLEQEEQWIAFLESRKSG